MTCGNEPRDSPRPAVITVVAATTIAQLAAVMGFAVYQWTGSYTATFGWLTIIVVLGLVFMALARNAERAA